MQRNSMKWLTLVMAFVMVVSMMVGCQPKQPDPPVKTDVPSTESPEPPTTEAPTETAPSADTKVFTDSVGREIHIPKVITRLAPSGPLAQVILFTAAPDRLCALARPFGDPQVALFGPEYAELPNIGQFYGKSPNFNLEAALLADPQVIVDLGQAKGSIVEDMDNMMDQINIPTVFIEAPFEGMPQAYRDLGEMIGETERTEQLAVYCEETLKSAAHAKASIPEDEQVRVYWAMGDLGLNTNAVGSFHSEALALAPVVNVADVEPASRGGGSEVSLEQIIQWDPDYILAESAALVDEIKNDPAWSTLRAVREDHILVVPSVPYGFLADPPSVNRYGGLRWLCAHFAPDYFGKGVEDEVRDFFELFYGVTLDDATLEKILAGTF
ncbi:MAG: ABC transporter substrate-binding protein [Saccharofermentanales bacterium]|jgi:iron complex transport system substrate-binding protein